MNRVESALRAAVEDLRASGVNVALVGGLAVSARTEPRFTRDVDLAIAVAGDREAERVANALTSRGYRILALVEQETAKRLATIRLAAPGEGESGVVVDLLVASSGAEVEIVAAAEDLEVFPGFRVPVARIGDLIAMKVLSRDDDRRPQDSADLRALFHAANAEDLRQARLTLERIRSRGFHRDRDLEKLFEDASSRLGKR